MADAVVQLVARFECTTGLTEDRVENVIHTAVDSATYLDDLAAAMAVFRDFYQVDHDPGAGTAVGAMLSPSLSRLANKAHILAYYSADLTGATPFGSPIGQLDFTLVAAGNATPMPNEVAVVMSTNADLSGVPISEANPAPPPATIRPASRRRGRMFIGPLHIGAGTFSNGTLRPSINVMNGIVEAGEYLKNNLILLGTQTWGVWSKLDATVWPIVEGYVDDAWDTQRRRGLAPTSRVLFNA